MKSNIKQNGKMSGISIALWKYAEVGLFIIAKLKL